MDQVPEASEGFPQAKLQLSSLLASCALSFGRVYGLIKDDDLGGQCIVSKPIISPLSPYQQFGRQQTVAKSLAKYFVLRYCAQLQSLWQGGYQARAQPFWHCLAQPLSCLWYETYLWYGRTAAS